MSKFNIVLSTEAATVVSEYKPLTKKRAAYQSEAELEKELLANLQAQGYEYLAIHSAEELVANLRTQLEKLNNYTFTDSEWKSFFNEHLANANEKDSIVAKTKSIQEDHVKVLKRENGTSKNITLIDKKNVHNNFVQVINQYETDAGNYANRYDVTILVNGFPLVHIELKRRGVALKEAFNQIERYQRDSFWAETGLYQYVQIFVISNGTHTKYYSNTTRVSAMNERANGKRSVQKTSHSFEFTSFWADANNKSIADLVDFTKTFFSKHTLLNVLTKYCVLTSENLLLVMRPYQIVATERILNRIEIATNAKRVGSVDAGGYIWHTTGSGKTLTSFKTAQLASRMPGVDKVLFVVDRKDLDYQTMKEYDRFEKGAANGNRNTKILQKQLENDACKIIVTTIQKLDIFVSKNKGHSIFKKHVVLIFDECHRSQFGEMHEAITKNFKNYHLFGFTGTPIFAKNASSGKNPKLRTTEQAFGDKLHTYTIVDAINDGNVLPFRIDYVNTMKKKSKNGDKQVEAIDKEKALLEPERVEKVVTYIREHFNQKTKRGSGSYVYSKLMNINEVAKDGTTKEVKAKQRLDGFNSIFAVSSVEAAKAYYTEFQRQLKESGDNLRVATIYSYGQNEDDPNGFVDDENSDATDGLDQSSRDFLEDAIGDYNKMFGTSHDTSSERFQTYYKELSLRMKNREIDILIVVNMFLTGFDATTLNTLWVDKNLKLHGLIQAFSRTNRILNSIKTFGNIVCFRNLEKETDDAIALFGDKNASGLVLMKSFKDYFYGYKDENGKKQKGYVECIEEFQEKYQGVLSVQDFCSEKEKKNFISLFGHILRLRNILLCFDEFKGQDYLTEAELQDFTGIYNDLYEAFKKTTQAEDIHDDVVFEMELVKQIEVNIDYILMLVEKYHQSNCKDKNITVEISRVIQASPQLRSKKELIDAFLQTINATSDVGNDWKKFVDEQRERDTATLIQDEKLKDAEARAYLDNMLRTGEVKTSGTDIDKFLPPMSRFGNSNRAETKSRVIENLMKFFEKYNGVV